MRDWNQRRASGMRWNDDGERLLERGRRAHEDISHFHEHLTGDERLGTAFATALGTLEGAKFASAHARVQALANESQTKPQRLEEYRELRLDATTLQEDESIILPKPVHELVDEVLLHPPEVRRDAVRELETQATTAPAAQPSAGRAPQGLSPTPHEVAPVDEVASGTRRKAGADEKEWLRGEEVPPLSVIEALQEMAREQQARQVEALKREREKREEEQKSETNLRSGPGLGM